MSLGRWADNHYAFHDGRSCSLSPAPMNEAEQLYTADGNSHSKLELCARSCTNQLTGTHTAASAMRRWRILRNTSTVGHADTTPRHVCPARLGLQR